MRHVHGLGAMAAVLASCAVFAAAAEGLRPYTVSAHMITVRSEESAELVITPGREPVGSEFVTGSSGGMMAYPGLPDVRLGKYRLAVDRGELTWNGSFDMPADVSAEMLSSPRVGVLPNQKATLRAGYPPIEYFDFLDDGLYRLHTTERAESPRIALDVTVSPGRAAETVDLDIGFALAVMTGREPVTGTHLDVGRPIVVTRELNTSLEMRLGEWRLLSALLTQPAETDSRQYLLIFLCVDPPPPPPTAASEPPTAGRSAPQTVP